MTRNWLKRLTDERVVVNTRDDKALRGVAVVHTDCVRLLGAEDITNPADPVKVPGELVVPRDNVSTVQRLGAAG